MQRLKLLMDAFLKLSYNSVLCGISATHHTTHIENFILHFSSLFATNIMSLFFNIQMFFQKKSFLTVFK